MNKQFLFFCFLVNVFFFCKAQDVEPIHWEIILPENFVKINNNLNKNKNIIKKNKVNQVVYKSLSSSIVDSSKTIYDDNGYIVSQIFWDDETVSKKHFAKSGVIKVQYPSYLLCNYGYDFQKRINRIDWYYDKFEINPRTIKPKYTYLIFYNKNGLMRKVIINDSLGINIGKVVFKYKNGYLLREIGYLMSKKYYKKEHVYSFDKVTDKIIKETVTFNNTIISESYYYNGSKIIFKSFEERNVLEVYSFKLDKYNKTEVILMQYFHNNNLIEEEYSIFLFHYNKNDNCISVSSLFNLTDIKPKLTTSQIIQYNEKGLVEKKLINVGGQEFIINYKYSYAY